MHSLREVQCTKRIVNHHQQYSLLIIMFSESCQNAPIDFEDAWKDLKKIMTHIIDGGVMTRTQFARAWKITYQINLNFSDKLFENASSFVLEYGKGLKQTLRNAPRENMTTKYVELWNILNKRGDIMDELFKYINQSYIKRISRPYEVILVPIAGPLEFDKPLATKHLLLKSWNETVLEEKESITTAIFNHLIKERESGTTEEMRQQTKLLVESLHKVEEYKVQKEDEHELYKKALEDPLLKHIDEFYTAKSEEYTKMLSADDYIKKCTQDLKLEERISNEILPASKELVTLAAWKSLAFHRMDLIIERFHHYFKNQDFESLSQVYHLMRYSEEAVKIMKQELRSHELKAFNELNNSTDESNYCQKFLEIYKRERNIIETVFQSHKECLGALDMAIDESWKNSVESKPHINQICDVLVKHCNQFLTKGTKGMEENEMETKMEDVIVIFKFIEEKDIFMKIYTRSLARRLINSASQSIEAEESMINKLRNVCGPSYVMGLEKMLQDVLLSKDLGEQLRDKTVSLPYSFDLLVTQTGSWPLKLSKSSLLVPQDLANGIQLVTKFYQGMHHGRKLNFHHSLSTCEINLNYPSKKFTVQTSISLMSILYVFNSTGSVKFNDIKSETGIETSELIKYLQFLGTQNILLCREGGKVTEESELDLNLKYENKRSKFKLVPVLKESSHETEQDKKVVVEDRKLFLQALIVRILKSKKTMSHKDLSNEIVTQSMPNFVPSQTLIKGVIKYLIGKEYLEMSEESEDIYNYLA